MGDFGCGKNIVAFFIVLEVLDLGYEATIVEASIVTL